MGDIIAASLLPQGQGQLEIRNAYCRGGKLMKNAIYNTIYLMATSATPHVTHMTAYPEKIPESLVTL